MKRAATDAQAQAVLDYACNPVHGLSCAPIKKGGRHFVPNTKRDHAEWAIDQFFKRRSQEPDAFPQQDCHFVGVATLDVPGNFYLTTRRYADARITPQTSSRRKWRFPRRA